MATGWGAYFASYVKKKEEAPKVEPGADDASIVPTKPMSVLSRSNTTTKKLYSSPAVPTTNVPPTRSNSNAARVANMFGYAAAAKAKKDLEAAHEVKEESKIVEEVNSLSSLKNLATQLQSLEEATHPVEARKPEVLKAKEKAKVAERVKSPSGLTSLAAQLQSLDEVEDLWESQKPNNPIKDTKDVSIAPTVFSFPKKSEPAHNATQTRMPAKSVPGPQEKRRVPKKGKSSISDLDALMGMLEMDLSMSTDTPSSRQKSTREQELSTSRSPTKLITTITTSMMAQKEETVTPVVSSQPWIPNSSADEPSFFASPIEAPIRAPSFSSPPIKAPLPALTEAPAEEIPIMLRTNLPPDPAETPRYFTLSSSPILESEDEEKYNGPTILEYQRMSEQIRQQQEQMEMERKRMIEEEERFEREEKKLAEEDEMMRQFVAEVEREEAKIREDEERQAREEREREQEILDEGSDYGDDSESDRRDSFDRMEAAQQRTGYQSPEVRIYEEEIEAERLKYTEEEDEARLEVQRLEDERLAKQQRQAEREQAELEKEARLEEERIKKERMAWRRRREEKERERERREEEEARQEAERLEEERMIQEEEERFEAERLEQERIAFEKRRAEEERQEQLRLEEEYRVEARRMEKQRIAERARLEEEREREEQLRFEEEEREQLRLEEEAKWEAERMQAEQERMNEQRRLDEEREQQRRYEEEQARLEAERIKQEQDRIAEQRRREQERQAQMEAEEESDDDPMDKEAQMRKAEEKIRAAFAGLAQERGQGSPALAAPIVPKANLGLDVTRAETGISRNNTIGMRPQPPPKSPGVMRLNTVAGRPGGLPSGPRGGGLPSGPRAGLPAGPRPRRT